MSNTKDGLFVVAEPSSTPTIRPFGGLPWDVVAKLIDTNTEEDPTGLGGIGTYFNHFLQWEGPVAEGSASGWVLSGVTGVATVALTNERGGAIALTADATANADPTLGLGSATLGAAFGYVAGKRLWVFARLKMATVASTEFFFGLGTPDTEPTVTNTLPSDGLFFEKAAAATKLDFHARQDGTSTEKTLIGNTLVDATYTVVGFQVDAAGNVVPFQDGVGLVAGVIAAGDANLPNVAADVLGFMLALRGASQVVTLDWLLLAQEL